MYLTYKRHCKQKDWFIISVNDFFPMLNLYAFLESVIHDKHFARFCQISTGKRCTHVEVWIKKKLSYGFNLIIFLFTFCTTFITVFCTKIIVCILKIYFCLYLFESLVCHLCVTIAWYGVCACAFVRKTHSWSIVQITRSLKCHQASVVWTNSSANLQDSWCEDNYRSLQQRAYNKRIVPAKSKYLLPPIVIIVICSSVYDLWLMTCCAWK